MGIWCCQIIASRKTEFDQDFLNLLLFKLLETILAGGRCEELENSSISLHVKN